MCNHPGKPCTLRNMKYWQATPAIQRDIDRLYNAIKAGKVLTAQQKGAALRMLGHVEPSPVPSTNSARRDE